MNQFICMGNLTRDPELKVRGDSKVVNISVAVNEWFKKSDGTTDKRTTYVDCEAWDSGAETIDKLFEKGDPILLNGSLRNNVWEKDGQKRTRTSIRISKFWKLNRAQAAQEQAKAQDDAKPEESSTTEKANLSDQQPPVGDDDIPF